MTKHEKTTLWISGIAIVVSVITPIMMYLMFNPIREEINAAGKLKSTERFLYDETRETLVAYQIDIENIGKRSLSDITIGISTKDGTELFAKDKDSIETLPIVPFEYRYEKNKAYIKIPSTLKSNDRLIISFLTVMPAKIGKENLMVSLSCSEGYAVQRNFIHNEELIEMYFDQTNGWSVRQNIDLNLNRTSR